MRYFEFNEYIFCNLQPESYLIVESIFKKVHGYDSKKKFQNTLILSKQFQLPSHSLIF